MSLKAISIELGLAKSAVRKHLIDSGLELRAHSYAQIKRASKARKMSERTAPYGYCLIQGKRVEDPQEQHILKIIMKWADQGMSHSAIARKLDDHKLNPRKASKWSQPTVGFIIKRHQEKN